MLEQIVKRGTLVTVATLIVCGGSPKVTPERAVSTRPSPRT